MSLRESQKKYWSKKHLQNVKNYFSSPPSNRRSKWFVDQLKTYKFDSICEAGMFGGRNLKHISEAFPDRKIYGFDINEKAIEFAKKQIPDATMWKMDICDLVDYELDVDVIYTSGTMIHLAPDTLITTIRGLIKTSNNYVMHLEECGDGGVVKGPKHLRPTKKVSDQIQWAPPLPKLYDELGYDVLTIPLPKESKTNGASELLIINTAKPRRR